MTKLDRFICEEKLSLSKMTLFAMKRMITIVFSSETIL